MVIRRITAGFRLPEAPHVGDVDENNPKVESAQLLGVVGFCYFDLHVDLASSNQPLSWVRPRLDPWGVR